MKQQQKKQEGNAWQEKRHSPSYNTAYTLRANALALRDIAPFGRDVVYAGNVSGNYKKIKMEELKRPDIIEVESFFNEYVEYFGGQVISKREDNLDDRPNADYLFKSEKVIAELKCFQKDLFNNEEDISRIMNFLDRWVERKLIKQADKLKIILGSKKLSIECYYDLLSACTKTIDRALHKANKQIQESKRTFSLPDAKGLVLLCNDGNYFVQNDIFLGLIANLMSKKYIESDIDGFVYFTINQVSTIPNSGLDWQLWVPSYRNENDSDLSQFVNDLGHKFLNEFYTLKTGIESSEKFIIDDTEVGYNAIKSMKYIPKEIIYKKK
ncbi:MAG TPA: hypothetical protein DCX03_02140 [Bacteroidales bacterium]|nr:hypothetical protein [Bacteroidales bacterium]